jgi:hypothetical protein
MSSFDPKILLDYARYKHLMSLSDKAGAGKEEDRPPDVVAAETDQAGAADKAEKVQRHLFDESSKLQQLVVSNAADALSSPTVPSCETSVASNTPKLLETKVETTPLINRKQKRQREKSVKEKVKKVKEDAAHSSAWYCIV